ncbi:hypothetical protein N0V86_003464 [Didymella sp. IMI 355093]|nr:hypothetical protein N0V86_003464 [Didymella sp. IMI 355093]
MGDHSEYEMETLAAFDNSEDPQAVSSPVTTPATTAPAVEPNKSKSKLSIFSLHEKKKTDESAKASTVPETAAESSKSGENAAPTEEVVPPLEAADDAALKTVSRLSPIVFDDNRLAGPSSSAPPLAEGVVPDADVLFQMPKTPSQSGRRRANGPKTEDKEVRYPLKIPEEPGDYPHISGPRNLKHFGPLPWRDIPNPAHILELGVPVQCQGKIAWSHIVKRMRDLDIDPAKLDMKAYQVLQNVETYRDLTAKLLELKETVDNGTYDERFKAWEEVREKKLYNWQTRTMNKKGTVRGLNDKRFSHQYPLGIEVDDPRVDPSLQRFMEAKKEEAARDAKEAAAAARAAGCPLLPPPEEQPKKTWIQRLKGLPWVYFIFSIIVFGPLVFWVLYGNMSQDMRDKFTEHS